MTAIELIKYIIDNNLIQAIIDNLGCHSFKEYPTEYRCGHPDHKNKTSIVIKKDTLKIKIFQSDSKVIRGNIITLVMTIKDMTFYETNLYLHKLFNLEYDYNKIKSKKKESENDKDPLDIFKKIKRRRNSINTKEIEIYDNSIIEEYEQIPYIDWMKEGILNFTCKRFNIGYSYKHKRIIIPIRYWIGSENDYLGIIGRTTIPNYEILDIPKYYPLKPYPKGINLYGLQENYKTIQEEGEVKVFESEKSVLKRYSRCDGTAVAVGSHNLSDEQVKILIGLNVNITIIYDKGISLQHIRSECERFYKIRNISYVYDKYDLLKDKESPADKSNKIYNYLLKYKIKYDELEHRNYMEDLLKEKGGNINNGSKNK
jgi:DNA primase